MKFEYYLNRIKGFFAVSHSEKSEAGSNESSNSANFHNSFNSALAWLHGANRIAPDDAIEWRVAPQALLRLFYLVPEHARCIEVKAAGAFGGGVTGADAERLEGLCRANKQNRAVRIGAAQLFKQVGLDCQIYGNAFIQIIRAPNGQILGISHLPAITMYRHKNAEDYIQVTIDTDGNEVRTDFKGREVIHLHNTDPVNDYYALPSWLAADSMIDLYESIVRYNAAFFRNNAKPESVIITKGQELTQEQKQNAKAFFASEFKGTDNAHRTLYLNLPDSQASLEIKQVAQRDKDADFLKFLEAIINSIPRAHGVPPRIVGIVSAGHLGGGGEVTGQLHVFAELTIKPIQEETKDQLNPFFEEAGIHDIAFIGIDLTPPDTVNVDSSRTAPAPPPVQEQQAQAETKRDAEYLDVLKTL